MTDQNKNIVTPAAKKDNKEETPFQRFLKETEAKMKKEEKHTWMIKDHDHLHQNE